MYDVKTRTRRSSVSAFSLCLLASRVESPSKSFENLKEMPTRCVAAGCGMHFIPYYGDERPGVRFSKLPKTFRARKAPRKAPENDFWCFSKHANISDPRKVASFFPDNFRVLESYRNAFSGMLFSVKWLCCVTNIKEKVIQNESLG